MNCSSFVQPLLVRHAVSAHAVDTFVQQRLRVRRRRVQPQRACLLCMSSSSSSSTRSDDGSRDEEFDISDLPREFQDFGKPKDGQKEKNQLYEFVKAVSPSDMVARFAEAAPAIVQKAIRQTIVSMLGSLPPTAFSPSVTTVSANLIQLFHSSLISGYMFRNAAYRLELTRSLGRANAPALPAANSEPEIRGGVAIFTSENGKTVEVPVDEYVSELRKQVSSLRDELNRERKGGNELLSFVSTLDKDNLESLTKNAGEEVIDAMKRVVAAVTRAQGIPDSPDAVVGTSAIELSQLLLYLMVSGFFLREAEVRIELQRSLGGEGAVDLKNLLESGPLPDSSKFSEEHKDSDGDASANDGDEDDNDDDDNDDDDNDDDDPALAV